MDTTRSVKTKTTLGRHLARRLFEIGVRDVFIVYDTRDFNHALVNQLVAMPGLNLIECCNDLNAANAADGYARARGVGACVIKSTVGDLSALDAIAGAYSENLPLVCISGGPVSTDYTIDFPSFSQDLRRFETVTCYQAVLNILSRNAHNQIDTAISTALSECKPVYINISRNLSVLPYGHEPVPLSICPRMSNKMDLEAAVEAAAKFLNKAVKPVMVAGPKLRVAKACDAFVELVNACGYATAVMPSAKGLIPEHHPHFIGSYGGAVSTPFCAKTVESADAYLFAGPILNDYSSVGYSLPLKIEKAIVVQPDRVVFGNGPAFRCVLMKDFLTELATKIKKNTTAFENYSRISVSEGQPLRCDPKEPLTVNIVFQHIQKLLSSDTAVIGDSWFNCQELKLPMGCGYEFQMQYGSIGWSIGATLGYAQAVREKRVLAFIGDSSFQVTAQEISTMLRCGHKTIIFLINDGGHTIEVEIHDDAIHCGKRQCWTTKVFYEEDLVEAIKTASGEKKDCLCFIEVIVHKDDTSKELLALGSRVSAANSRPPNPSQTNFDSWLVKICADSALLLPKEILILIFSRVTINRHLELRMLSKWVLAEMKKKYFRKLVYSAWEHPPLLIMCPRRSQEPVFQGLVFETPRVTGVIKLRLNWSLGDGNFSLVGSADGILCFYFNGSRSLFGLWNPVIRGVRIIDFSDYRAIGFGFGAFVKGEYNIIAMVSENAAGIEALVYSASVDRWQPLESKLGTYHHRGEERRVINDIRVRRGTLIKSTGSMWWLCRNKVLEFNFSSGSLKLVGFPGHYRNPFPLTGCLIEIDNCLHIFVDRCSQIDWWKVVEGIPHRMGEFEDEYCAELWSSIHPITDCYFLQFVVVESSFGEDKMRLRVVDERGSEVSSLEYDGDEVFMEGGLLPYIPSLTKIQGMEIDEEIDEEKT